MAQVYTGAKGIVKIGGQTVAFVGGLNVNAEYTLTDVDIIGQLEVGDLAETAHKATGTINLFKVVNADGTVTNTAAALGIDTSSDPDVSAMRDQAYFDIEVVDSTKNDAIIYKMLDCKIESGSGQMDARGVWQGTWNFRARKAFGM